MQFTTLHQIPTEQIRQAFNGAFSDYITPLQLSSEQLAQRMQSEGTTPALSAGVWDGQQLVGFILNAKGAWKGTLTAYNGGTGVLPGYRGQQLTRRMYAFLHPLLQAAGIQQCLLEVIEGNEQALHTYQAIGFRIVRELDAYKGYVSDARASQEVVALKAPDWQLLQGFWDWQPSWQHSRDSLQRAADSYSTFGLRHKQHVLAYATINPLNNRLVSLGVAPNHRRRGLARQLLAHLQHLNADKPLSIINVDAADAGTRQFLKAVGLQKFLRLYEMEWTL